MRIPGIGTKLIIGILIFLLGGLAAPSAAERFAYRSLADQIDDLAFQNNFEIDGLELTDSQPPQRVSGNVRKQVKRLLAGFNYVTILSVDDSIERVIILGEKQIFPRGTILHTQRKGKNHAIDGRITGINGKEIDLSLVIDTGADYLVLPKSMMESLGVDPDTTETRKLQTANGLIESNISQLKTLQIGNELIPDVEAAFIEDEQLGDAKLLGMNVLKRYRFTLDDRQQTVTLIKMY